MKSFCLLAMALFLSLTPSFSQQRTPGYIMTDSAMRQGKVRNIGNGQIEYRRADSRRPLMYQEADLNEYSTGKETYEALVIDGHRRFYERLIVGTTQLYRGNGSYVLKTGGSFVAFNKKNFRSIVSASLPCEGNDRSFSRLTYSGPSLKRVVKRSNENRCNTDAIPHRKLGAYAGYNFLTYELSNSELDFSGNDRAVNIGLFFDLPIHRASSIYFTGDVSWLTAKPILYSTQGNNTHYAALNMNQFTTQGNFKFVTGHGSLRPYFKLGAFISFVDASAPEGLINTTLDNSVINIAKDEFNEKSVSLFGFNVSAGLEIKVTERKNLHLEIKHQRSAKGNVQPYNIKYSTSSLSLGFNI